MKLFFINFSYGFMVESINVDLKIKVSKFCSFFFYFSWVPFYQKVQEEKRVEEM